MQNQILQDLLEVLLLWVESHRLEKTDINLFGHFEAFEAIEQVACQQFVMILVLSFTLGGDWRDKHPEKDHLNVRDGFIQFVSRVDHAEDEQLLIFSAQFEQFILEVSLRKL